MLEPKIFTTKPDILSTTNFNPRNYDPVYLFVKNGLKNCPDLSSILESDVTSGSTPPYWLFRKKHQETIVPYVKTSAISRDFINLNDLHYIPISHHNTCLKRSITRPYYVIFSMTGKFMGKAALCPPQIAELNMTQNSVVLRCKSHEQAAFLCIYLNSIINQTQIKGLYSITKQKYLNQTSIRHLKILEYSEEYEEPLKTYLQSLSDYYSAVIRIQKTIANFNKLVPIDESIFDVGTVYSLKLGLLHKKIFTPVNYRPDYLSAQKGLESKIETKQFDAFDRTKGNEIGSKNYLFEGIPLIKTSDYINFGVDYQPDYYCSVATYEELGQNLQRGDVLFTKDGKVGQTAIVEESAKLVYTSGSVRIRPCSQEEGYWVFLVLSSLYGKILFERWTVIASTMAHLRKDFFEDFKFPLIDEQDKATFLLELKNAFLLKREAYAKIEEAKKSILGKIYEIIKV